jgi:hypothetical protein
MNIPQQQNQPKNKNTFDILIKYYAVPKKKRIKSFFTKNHDEIIQGEPFEWGVTIKNIGGSPTPDAKIKYAEIYCEVSNIHITMDSEEVFVRSLNPGEEIKLSINNCKCYTDGALWARISIIPNDTNCSFITYQFDSHHNKNMLYSKKEELHNIWIDSIYIQNKMEVLQAQTNSYILLLTIVTAWESIFGIKSTLKNILQLISYLLATIHEFIMWLIGIF